MNKEGVIRNGFLKGRGKGEIGSQGRRVSFSEEDTSFSGSHKKAVAFLDVGSTFLDVGSTFCTQH